MADIPYHFSSEDAPVLYHYTSTAGAIAIIASRSFWLSESTAMNDTSEFRFAQEQLEAIIASGEVRLGIVSRLAVAIAVNALRSRTGQLIGSLTTSRDDLTQWRLYGDNAAGCVIGIDAHLLEHEAGVAIRTVQYEPAMVRTLLLSALSVVQEASTEEPYNFVQLTEFAQQLAVELFTIKHPCYADEREIRIMRMLLREGDKMVDRGGNRTGGAAVRPLPVLSRETPTGRAHYIALPLVRDDGSSAIVSIGFGPRAADVTFEENAPSISAHGIEVWRSRLPYR